MSKKIAVVEPEGIRNVFHLLHGKQPGVVKAHRVHRVGNCGKGAPTEDVAFVMPDDGREVHLKIDPRDQRTLVIFDGRLLPNGLPRGSKILQMTNLTNELNPTEDAYAVSWGQSYKIRDTDPLHYADDLFPRYVGAPSGAALGTQKICRIFALLKSCTAAFVRFDRDRLAPYYVLCKVEKDGPAATVTWISSSRM